MKTSKKPAAQPNTTTITLTAAEGPEALRHERMWVVATKTGRENPWTLVTVTNGEANARLVFDAFKAAGARIALVPPTIDREFSVRTNASAGSGDREWHHVKYVATPTRPVEMWDDGKRVV